MSPKITLTVSIVICLILSCAAFGAGLDDLAPCAVNAKIQGARSSELKKLYDEDQKDREEIESHPERPVTQDQWVKVGLADLKRRKRVAEIFAEGCFKSAPDYASAAMVFQHGMAADHFYQAFLWFKQAYDLGDTSQKKNVALGIDRYLVNSGYRQLFGTQSKKMDMKDLCWCLEPIEPEFGDSSRAQYGQKSKEEVFQLLATKLNSGNSCPNIECKMDLKPAPKGRFPGIW